MDPKTPVMKEGNLVGVNDTPVTGVVAAIEHSSEWARVRRDNDNKTMWYRTARLTVLPTEQERTLWILKHE